MLALWVRIVLNPYLRAWRKKNLYELQFDGLNSNSVLAGMSALSDELSQLIFAIKKSPQNDTISYQFAQW